MKQKTQNNGLVSARNDIFTTEQINQQLLNLLSDYIYTVRIKDGEALDTTHGPGCVSITGYTSEDYRKDPELWYRMVYEDDRQAVTEQASQARKGENVEPLEHRIVHRDGSIRWVRNTIVLLRDENGDLYAYNGLINDITAQKEAEISLRESEEKYRSLTDDVLESSPIGTSILDANLNIVWVNKAYMEFLGVDREQVIGKNARVVVRAYLQSIFEAASDFVRRVNTSYSGTSEVERFECRVRAVNGLKERWLEYTAHPIKTGLYKGGRIEHYTDITEHKQVIDEVVESERRQSQLLHHLTDYIYSVKVKNGKPVYTYHGQGCVAVTGYTQEDFVVNPDLWIDMVHAEDRPAVREHARKALLGIASPPLDHRILHRNGSQRWVKSTIVHQKDELGRVISYDGLISDITELKEAEVRDRITQQQLMQADKMATLGILVSGVAHEINNPNNFIKLNAQMVSKVWAGAKPILEEYFTEYGDFVMAGMPYSVARDKVDDLICGLGKGAKRIEKIVSSLKDYARQDVGDRTQNINLNEVIEAAILIVNNLIKKSTDKFSVDYDPKLPMITGNFQQLEQVMINLITNSCQALKKQPRDIYIRTWFEADKKTVNVEVRDNGVGISDKDIKHVLDPFFTTKRERGGTGLGLSIAYKILQDHDGEMHFNSSLGKGTTAQIVLPVKSKKGDLDEKPHLSGKSRSFDRR